MLKRLDQILSNYGICSRSEAKKLVKRGFVTVNDKPVYDSSGKADPHQVAIEGTPLEYVDGIFVRMNKPAGYVCSHAASEGQLVYNLLPDEWMRRKPAPQTIGRLDRDTTGVLLITDRNDIAHVMSSPKKLIEKTYQVTVDKALSNDLIVQFASGTILLNDDDKPLLPAKLVITSETACEVSITEGRYHQVKRMFIHFGYEVVKLHRSKFGPYTDQGLKPGEWEIVPVPE